MSKAFIDFLESIVAAENILLEEPMHKNTTFRVGGQGGHGKRIDRDGIRIRNSGKHRGRRQDERRGL